MPLQMAALLIEPSIMVCEVACRGPWTERSVKETSLRRRERAVPERRSLAPQRRQAILDLVVQNQRVDVAEISERFGVSRVTARGDLEYLAKQNLITRARGGAVASLDRSLASGFSERALLNREAKRRIAKAALEFLVPGETVILDAGTTLFELSSLISTPSELTVITPALNIAIQLGSLTGLDVVTVGGKLDRSTISSIGSEAERQLRDALAHKVFLGTHLIDEHGDVAEPSAEIAIMKRAMVQAARQVILLADSSKWSVTSQARAKVAPLSSVHTVITDSGISKAAQRAMKDWGVDVVIA